LTQRASEAWNTETTKRIDQIGARASVQARIIRLTVINVRLAEWARKTSWTYTFKTIDFVDTRTAVLATIHRTVVHLKKSKRKTPVNIQIFNQYKIQK
jgi:hypothetical protein